MGGTCSTLEGELYCTFYAHFITCYLKAQPLAAGCNRMVDEKCWLSNKFKYFG